MNTSSRIKNIRNIHNAKTKQNEFQFWSNEHLSSQINKKNFHSHFLTAFEYTKFCFDLLISKLQNEKKKMYYLSAIITGHKNFTSNSHVQRM